MTEARQKAVGLPRGVTVRRQTWTRVNKATGVKEKFETRNYYVFYRDENGDRRQVPGFESRTRTEELARQLLREKKELQAGREPAVRARGDVRTVTAWIDQFESHLRATGNRGEAHVRQVVGRVRRVFAGVSQLRGVTGEHVEQFLARLRKNQDASAQTCKHYLVNARQFTRWLVRKKKVLGSCPLSDVETPRVQRDRRRVRRAASAEELQWLYRSMRAHRKLRRRLRSAERVWLYVVSTATGYRAKELAVLCPADFALDGDEPAVILPGKYTKNDEPAVQPIDPALVPGLRLFLAKIPPRSKVWPGKWADATWAGQMLKKDLAQAREDYIAEEGITREERQRRRASTFLAYKDHRDRYLDFHSLRVTYITSLARAGLPNSVVQKLARHSSWELTARVYIDNGLSQLARSVHNLGMPGGPEEDDDWLK